MNAVLIREPGSRVRRSETYSGTDDMEEAIRNLQIHVTDIKAEVRVTNSRLDSLRDKMEQDRDKDRRETKAEFTAIRAEIGSLRENMTAEFIAVRAETKAEFTAVRAEISSLREDMTAEFKAVRTEMKSEFAEARKETDAKIGELRAETQEGFKSLRAEMQVGYKDLQTQIIKLGENLGSAKVWALTFYIVGLGGLLLTMAHGFKWL